MSDYKQEHLVKEADRLLSDEILKLAFDNVRAEALEALALADADDKTAILRLQAKVTVIQEVRDELSRMIIRGRPQSRNEQSYA